MRLEEGNASFVHAGLENKTIVKTGAFNAVIEVIQQLEIDINWAQIDS